MTYQWPHINVGEKHGKDINFRGKANRVWDSCNLIWAITRRNQYVLVIFFKGSLNSNSARNNKPPTWTLGHSKCHFYPKKFGFGGSFQLLVVVLVGHNPVIKWENPGIRDFFTSVISCLRFLGRILKVTFWCQGNPWRVPWGKVTKRCGTQKRFFCRKMIDIHGGFSTSM